MKNKINSIFVFTRDLRLEDNTGLITALKESETVIPIFILNPIQIEDTNKYKSDNCVQFMVECLEELNERLKEIGSRLYIFYDKPDKCIERLLTDKELGNIDGVYINMDYTPFARKRIEEIKKITDKYDVELIEKEDYVLTGGIETVKKKDDSPYMKFTPYYREATKIKVREPIQNKYKNYIDGKIKIKHEYHDKMTKLYEENKDVLVRGGRDNALKILKNVETVGDKYNERRDYPIYETTLLSAYMKFNVVSIREIYKSFKKKLKKNSKLFNQLYWRDFYMMIMHYNPHVIGGPMKIEYNIKWDNNKTKFKKWTEGKTGIPIVDAGMRQLNTTGWMHNRLRMIVANFLIKILHIDWLWGEKYFASKLIDYDPANNNGGWQWSSSTGSDSQPYFRIFNPWLQSEKFDKDALYIKKWVPELKDVPPKAIHTWYESYVDYDVDYYDPIVIDMKKEKDITIKMYKNRK